MYKQALQTKTWACRECRWVLNRPNELNAGVGVEPLRRVQKAARVKVEGNAAHTDADDRKDNPARFVEVGAFSRRFVTGSKGAQNPEHPEDSERKTDK